MCLPNPDHNLAPMWRFHQHMASVIFVNENENENGEKRENNEFVNEN